MELSTARYATSNVAIEGSLLHSQVHSTFPYPEPDKSGPHHAIRLNIIHLRLDLPNGLFLSGFPTNNLCAFSLILIHATFPAHILDLIILIILGEEYKS
jgi:hypothetical protein